ncbi:FAD-dependent oxidoreductase [Nocardia asiatica]|uniref:FAD-dependent oxidoreductase n=1 Tax=Nocardia asiatica TaxID=209252 RepID=UPI0002FA6723|nr:NAD(P)-binding protein [Nocardia asiatica]
MRPVASNPSPAHDALDETTGLSGAGTVVVIGGGHAGMLAAWALRGHAREIVVVERDHYPAAADFRAGVPQGRHAHLLLEAGHRALNDLMPGIRDDLLAAGAVRVSMSGDLRWLSSAGWMAEHTSDLEILSCTRPLLDDAVRRRVSGEPTVKIMEGATAVGLLGSPTLITGVRIRLRGNSDEVRLPAELVIDASGRTSALPAWLTELGASAPPEQRCDPGVAYSSRLFHRPAGVERDFTALYLQTAPGAPRTGSLLPVEGDRWIVSLGGMRGAHPGKGEAGFTAMLEQLRDPILRNVLRAARPASEVRGFIPGPGVRRHYEHRSTPDGLVVIGDASCTFNPVYGQGLTLGILGAQALRAAAARHGGIGPATARATRKRIAAVSKNAWLMSTSEDARFPATDGGPSGALTRIQHRFLDRVLESATSDPHVTAAFHRVMSLVAPPTSLLHPRVLVPVLLGKG